MAWREREGADEQDQWWNQPDVPDPYTAPAPQVNAPAPAPTNAAPPPTTGGGSTRNPNAGPPGSTTPNMDPPGVRGGYWGDDGQWVQGSPYGGGGGGGGGSTSTGGGLATFAAPSYPGYQSAGPFTPRDATFEFDPYKPLTPDALEKLPGYQASRDQLKKQIEAGAAHRGMVRSGMTIGDLYTNLDALAQQNLRGEDDRQFRAWDANYTGARNKFLDEYGIDKDVYSFKAGDIDRSNNYNFNVADRVAADALARWKTQVESLTTLARPVD